jgi:hypothetical protein
MASDEDERLAILSSVLSPGGTANYLPAALVERSQAAAVTR